MSRERVNNIDLRRMRAVVEVARTQAITTAAEALGVTQSAVSRTVAEVEEALGQRLFDRLPRGIQLTEAGELFVARAKRVLVDVDDLVAEVAVARNRVSGRLRLGIAASGWHAKTALLAFIRAHPAVAVETVHASDQALYPKLLHGEIDLILGSSNYLQRWHDLEVTQLTRLYFACMVRLDHPLAMLGRPSELDVLGYPLILTESVEPAYADIAQRYAHHALPALRPHYVTSDPDLIGSLLQETDAFLPLMHPSPDFGGLGRHFFLLRDVVELPVQYLSYARAAHRPRSRVVEVYERFLLDDLARAEAAAEAAASP
jgi:DNA-binding transcriptional LysR family regulator